MNRYRVIIRRTTYEIIDLLSLSEAELEMLVRRNEGVRIFKVDNNVEVLGKELVSPTTTLKESL